MVLRLTAAAVLLAVSMPASAQQCKPEDVFAVIDATGQRLREINAQWQPRQRDKLKELAAARGWSEADAEARARPVIEDEETRRLDARAAELLSDIDRLGDDTRTALPACERLEQVRNRSAQLAEVTAQRAAHVIARIEIALKPAAAVATAPPPPPPRAAAPPAPPATGQVAAPLPAPRVAAPVQAAPPAAAPAWQATVQDGGLARDGAAPPTAPGDAGFSPEDIRAAGRGFFGSISAGLASVIDHAFQRYGRPTGYILGDEGGGAFVAGLRYGKGRLVTKQGGERVVYWQGPSAGFDFGVAGSQVMFLVYGVEDHEQLFQRFTGIDGSAYLVGGVGITFMRRGKVTLAPIRTGLGVRVGANLGYLKFTPRPSLNPF
jgi:hypothetical protein